MLLKSFQYDQTLSGITDYPLPLHKADYFNVSKILIHPKCTREMVIHFASSCTQFGVKNGSLPPGFTYLEWTVGETVAVRMVHFKTHSEELIQRPLRPKFAGTVAAHIDCQLDKLRIQSCTKLSPIERCEEVMKELGVKPNLRQDVSKKEKQKTPTVQKEVEEKGMGIDD